MKHIKTNLISLNYECADCATTGNQPLLDILYSGTLICADCGEDMQLAETVTVNEDAHTPSTPN